MRKLTFSSLQVSDLKASREFYTEKLGFQVLETPNPDACVFRYNKDEASFAIRKPIGNLNGKELGVGVSLWFAVDENMEDLQKRLSEAQVTLTGPILSTPFGKALTVKDPDGYALTFLQADE